MVNLLELLRIYGKNYVRLSNCLGIISAALSTNDPKIVHRDLVISALGMFDGIKPQLIEAGLTATAAQAARAEETWNLYQKPELFAIQCTELLQRLEDELSLMFFFKLSQEGKEYFEKPFKNWGGILKRFPNIVRDVEEMNKCFALCRYTAAMYHAIQVAEGGAIELGNYIGVTDHRKGWGPTERKLREIIKAGYNNLPHALSGKFPFLEQMHREIDSMVLAWRNKLDHAADRLAILPNQDFTPDIAEHIMGAVRMFMLRLGEGMA